MSKRIEQIVIGTSLAEASDRVLQVGLACARATNAAATLVHAFPLPASYYAASLGMEALEHQPLEIERERWALEVEAQLLRLDAQGQEGIEVVADAGAPHRLVVEVAERRGADLLVVGGRESRGPMAPLLGSTADRILRKASCPVLIVREAGTLPPKRVVAPVDLSSTSESALRQGLAWLDAWTGDARVEVEVLFVLSRLDREALAFAPAEMDRFAARQVRELMARVRGESRAVLRSTVRVGFAREEILQHLRDAPCDLVLLSTHGGGGLERLLLGSVAASVSQRAPNSVLFLPSNHGTIGSTADPKELGAS